MRRSWPANLIAAMVIAATLGVGALGALGSPQANGDAGRTSRGPTPTCTGRLHVGALSFRCPAGWYVWQNVAYHDGASPAAEAIISNHAPATASPGSLPDGWFKVDVYVSQRDAHLTFEQLAEAPCTSSEGSTVESCSVVSIGGRRWTQRIERDPSAQYREIATVVDGVERQVVAIVPTGPRASNAARDIDPLLSSLSIR
ncbi:MAG TPA: hypothetical protein VJ818_07725 [Actinomycetota bacterium]|nr:hypothetical protein [Actinomycetota bacterium]